MEQNIHQNDLEAVCYEIECMNLPTEKLYRLGRHKMFKCWKCSSSDP